MRILQIEEMELFQVTTFPFSKPAVAVSGNEHINTIADYMRYQNKNIQHIPWKA